MNGSMQISADDRLEDLTQAYSRLREEIKAGATVDAQKATALAQLSIALSLLERDAYTEEDEDEYEEEDGEDGEDG
jgi:hypothetical protein